MPSTIPVERRGFGRVLVEVRGDGGRTVRGRIEEQGFARVRFPLSGRRGAALEAVMINTGGGLAGGDRSQTVLHALEAAQFVVTTQAAEKVYRSDGAVSRIDVDLSVAPGAGLDWMPQATIVFDGARIERSISAEVAPQGRLLLVEPVILGRTARGERFSHGLLFDRWRIRRGGRLVYADGLQLDGDIAAVLDRRATLGGWAAFATILLVAPDAESRLEAVRAALGLPDELTGKPRRRRQRLGRHAVDPAAGARRRAAGRRDPARRRRARHRRDTAHLAFLMQVTLTFAEPETQ